MFKHIDDHTWIFDAEWVPDPATGRRVLGLPDTVSDDDVVARMFERAGADADNRGAWLKTVLCRIVSLAAIKRHAPRGAPLTLELRSLPEAHEPALDEA